MTHPDFRALCAELYQCVEHIDRICYVPVPSGLLDRARAALSAAPPPLTPQQQHAMDAFDNLLKICTDNLGEAIIRRAILGGEA